MHASQITSLREDTVKVAEIPKRAELANRAAELVPLLRENALWQERNRRLSHDVVEALTAAGIFRMRVPVRFGGYECDTNTLVDVAIQLGRGDGSAAFNVAAWWIMTWNVCHFPDEVQEEIFSDPDVRICGTLAPTGMAVPRTDGVVVSGEWAFNSGAAHSTWKLLSAILPAPDGSAEPILAVVPMSALEVVDDWDVSGLRGTGSITTIARDVFIPAARYMRISALMRQEYASKLNAESPIYRGPMIGAISASTGGKLVGLATAASEAFFERLPGRPITNTVYTSQAEAPITHLQVADASLKIQEAEFHARRLADMVDQRGISDEPWSLADRAYARVAVGRACQLAHEAVSTFNMASGATSIYSKVPIQRIQRDVQAINLHALNLPSTNLELYGRVLCGLEPNTFFV
jgi:alkylation response protein AidB-like acyl-CoA dehydrogenase